MMEGRGRNLPSKGAIVKTVFILGWNSISSKEVEEDGPRYKA